MLIHRMPETLAWIEPQEVLSCVYRDYVTFVSDAFGDLLREAKEVIPEGGERLAEVAVQMPDASFMRVLTAPETTYRLLWRRESVSERCAFIGSAFLAERARQEGCTPIMFEAETWTALGDVGFTPEGGRIDNPVLEGGIPFDVRSPHAASVDLGGPSGLAPRPPFTPGQLEETTDKINQALRGIAATTPALFDFVTRFNLVFIAQIDNDDPTLFTSGSTGQYIGRSFVTNPHQESVHAVDLAEAFVHEGTHALLYMQERRKPWVLRPEYYEAATQRVASPWTGSILGLRPFLQACFVWYGLLHFWSAAMAADAFPEPLVRGRMMLALRGFLAGPLVDRVREYHSGIADDVLDAIATMQFKISESWQCSRKAGA